MTTEEVQFIGGPARSQRKPAALLLRQQLNKGSLARERRAYPVRAAVGSLLGSAQQDALIAARERSSRTIYQQKAPTQLTDLGHIYFAEQLSQLKPDTPEAGEIYLQPAIRFFICPRARLRLTCLTHPPRLWPAMKAKRVQEYCLIVEGRDATLS